ncbi:hypothetical protein NQ317_001273, partial [Molorchus minor]
PVVVALYVKLFQEDKSDGTPEKGWVLGSAVVILPFINILFFHHCWIGRHKDSKHHPGNLLKLNHASLAKTNSGQIVNLLSNDVQRLEEVALYLPYIYLTPMVFVGAVFILYGAIGISCVPGLAVMVLESLPLQGILSRIQGKLRLKVANLTDRRIRLINEVITGIKIIKMYAWEIPFQNVIKLSRRLEMNSHHKILLHKGLFSGTSVTHVLLGKQLTADIVFCLAQLFNILQNYMCYSFPLALASYAEANASISRIQEFLLLQEKATVENTNILPDIPCGSIRLSNVTAKWSPHEVVLRDISLEVRPGMLVCILGGVGSGKSSFLQMLLNEMAIFSGKLKSSGKMSYASQEPWLFVSSIKQNILFGQEYIENKYKDIVRVCALEEDLQQFPFGDKTIVGDRVDTGVSKHLFDECILKYLKNKTRILITHHVHLSRYADITVVLDKGKITHVMTKEVILDDLEIITYSEGSNDRVHSTVKE